jgi:CarD family transcriptional regulator
MPSTVAKPRTVRRGAGFDVGDLVVHPYHGAGVVVSRRRRRLLGGAHEYLEIYLAHSSLKILVPCEAAASVGLRAVVGPRGLRSIVAVLEDVPAPSGMSWSARRKHYQAKLHGGDVLELAAVVRDLAARAAESKLSSSERELYERSRCVLVSELRYALGVDAERAAAYIDEHLASSPRPCEE